MTEQELSSLSDEQLLAQAKKMKSARWQYAMLIGFMAGIVIFSVFYGAVGLFTLIPLYLIFKVLHQPERDAAMRKALRNALRERGLDSDAAP